MFSITLFCIPLRQVLSKNLETIFLFLAGSQQGPTKNLLAPPQNTGAPETGKKISTQVLMVVWQALLATESYFQPIPVSLERLCCGRRGKIPSHLYR